MTECFRPLDESDVDALATGGSPGRADASSHAAACPRCGAAVVEARALADLLGDPVAGGPPPAALADRILRIRPFSRAERTSLSVWSAPLLLLGALSVSGLGLVAGGFSGGLADGAGAGAAAAAAVSGLVRALARRAAELAATAPTSLAALADVLRPTAAGWAALLLLLPAGFGLRRLLAPRAARR